MKYFVLADIGWNSYSNSPTLRHRNLRWRRVSEYKSPSGSSISFINISWRASSSTFCFLHTNTTSQSSLRPNSSLSTRPIITVNKLHPAYTPTATAYTLSATAYTLLATAYTPSPTAYTPSPTYPPTTPDASSLTTWLWPWPQVSQRFLQ